MAQHFNFLPQGPTPGRTSFQSQISSAQSKFGQISNLAFGLAGQLSDPTSQFFQRFRAGLGQSTGQIGVNALLAPLMAGGGNFASSQFIAGQQRKAFGKRREDFLNRATSQFASGALGQVGNLLGIAGQGQQAFGNLALGQRELDLREQEQQASLFDFLSPIFGAGASAGVGGLFGGGAGAAGAGGATALLPLAASDIRLKENIEYTGEKTKDGIPIVLFNYKENSQRFKGVISRDVKRIKPEAVARINGYEHVNYNMLR